MDIFIYFILSKEWKFIKDWNIVATCILNDSTILTSAFSKSSPIVAAFYEKAPMDIMLTSSDNRAIVIKSSLIPLMATRTSGGSTLMSLKKGSTLVSATTDLSAIPDGAKSLKKIKVPATGVPLP